MHHKIFELALAFFLFKAWFVFAMVYILLIWLQYPGDGST